MMAGRSRTPTGDVSPQMLDRSEVLHHPLFIFVAGADRDVDDVIRCCQLGCALYGNDYSCHVEAMASMVPEVARASEAAGDNRLRVEGPNSRTQELVRDAHRRFFDRLFATAARDRGVARWGVASSRLTFEHSRYLHWLYPQATIVLLIRDPYEAYRTHFHSTQDRETSGRDKTLDTVGGFGRRWRSLVDGFVNEGPSSDAAIVRFEDVAGGQHQALEARLQMTLNPGALGANRAAPPTVPLPALIGLERHVRPLASRLGYAGPRLPAARQVDALHPGKCMVLVAGGTSSRIACEDALRELERRGYPVWRVSGWAAIDQARNESLSSILASDFDATMWIEPTIVFEPDAVDRLRAHGKPIVGGIYPRLDAARSVDVLMPTGDDELKSSDGLVEVRRVGAGFLYVHTSVYFDIQRQLSLPLCNERFGGQIVPVFWPMVVEREDSFEYLREDAALCERARQCGYQIYVDPSIRLQRVGSYLYEWERP